MNKQTGIKDKFDTTSLKKLFARYGLVFIVAIIIIIMCFAVEAFRQPTNLLNICKQISINGIIALGMCFVIMTGGIDLSVGSTVALSTVVAGSVICMAPDNNLFILYAALAAVAVCAVVGILNGVLIAYLKLPPFIATLGMMEATRGIAYIYCNGQPYILNSANYKLIGQGYVGVIPVPAIILVVFILIFAFVLNRTKFGRHMLATGGNEKAAMTSGVNTKKIKMIVYTLCGIMAGVAGFILSSRVNSGNPSLAEGYELDAIAAVVIGGVSMDGGVGSIFGTVLGILTLGLIQNSLNMLGVSSYLKMVFQGLIILVAVFMDLQTRKLEASSK